LMKGMNFLYTEMPLSHSCEGRNLDRVLQKDLRLISNRDSGHTQRNDLKYITSDI
jgi:hypothetical protein